MIISATFMVFIPFFTFANEPETVITNKAINMLDSQLFMREGGIEKLQVITKDLTYEEKSWLSNRYTKNPSWAWMNILLPSSGNWIVGDHIGGLVAIGGTFISVLLYSGTILSAYSTHSLNTTAIILMISFSIVYLGTDIYSICSAYSYVNIYNNNLNSALNYPRGAILLRPLNVAMNYSGFPLQLFHIDLIQLKF